MRHINNAILVLAYTAMVSSSTTPLSALKGPAAVCGDLGILNISPGELPEGVEPSDLRLCADHPMGRNRTVDPNEGASLAPMEEEDEENSETTPTPSASLFEEKSCWYASPYGCSRGYCWKNCGPERSGRWCWVATQLGAGPWKRCTSWEDCSALKIKGSFCAKGCVISSSCGCGC
ncbi:hypothetical protein BKA59DRAFT_530383 [Fusarium tricinctum]|uniref:IDI-2 n=1 Tax=Fusarium tricinctum TaxID=61284 RepID=A0A8K0WBW5_9HYPO|nr:hypothetical protein BKA59DRAFT_530383 [Fusarium tricinctum]